MKRKLAGLLTGVSAAALLLSGCAGNEAKTEYVTVGGYKGIEIEDIEEPEEVTDEDVENYIDAVLSQYGTLEEITDRAVAEGDVVNIDFVGTMDGVEFDGGSTEGQGYTLQVGSGTMIDGFEDSIIGHTPGETYDWNGQFPDPYTGNPDYSGKAVTFAITVNYIGGETIIPDLTDELVQEISTESKTVKEYKEEVKELLTENGTTDYDSQIQQAAWSAVLEKAEVVSYPEDQVEEMMETIENAYTEAAEASGMELEEYMQQNYGVDLEQFHEDARETVEEALKEQLVAEAIAEEEKLMPTDQELEEEYEKMAQDYGYSDVDALKEAADEDTLKNIVVQTIVKEWIGKYAIQVKE